MESTAILDVAPPLGFAELEIPREPERACSRVTDHLGDRGSALWLLHAEAALPVPEEPRATSPSKDSSLRAASAEEEPIFVDGRRLVEEDEPGIPGSTNQGGDPTVGGGDTGMGGGGWGDVVGDFDEIAKRVSIDPDANMTAEERERAEIAEQKLEVRMREINKQIKGLADNAVVRVGDQVLTGAELKALWPQLSIVITKGLQDGPVGAGQNTGGVYRINLEDIEQMIALDGMPGFVTLDHLFLHELAHLIPFMINYADEQWFLYRSGGGDPSNLVTWQSSEYFQNIERMTGAWTETLADTLGVDIVVPSD